jgi:hypothetical protein
LRNAAWELPAGIRAGNDEFSRFARDDRFRNFYQRIFPSVFSSFFSSFFSSLFSNIFLF